MRDRSVDHFWVCARVLAGIALSASLVATACGGSATVGGASKLPAGMHSEALGHEDCSESGNHVETLDTNGDGKPDIRRVSNGAGHEVCRVVDLNHDGKPDLYEYFDANGAPRRREYCYDDSGVVNAVEYYEGGKLVRREYDTSGQHRIDTWDWFDPNAAPDPKTGRPKHPLRRERDTTGDGQVDQWWAWEGDKVTIAVDRTGDGKPDPETAIVLGGGSSGGGGADTSASGSSSGTGTGPSAMPGDAGAGTTSSPAPAASASTAKSADGGKP
jgi:hypothetical protein